MLGLEKSGAEYTEVSAGSTIPVARQGADWMNMYNSLFSDNCVLNEQIARQIFDILPEQGPIMTVSNCVPKPGLPIRARLP